jgi:short-subunit dehydrogenase involved in D-alanine esterification of teichoic acids
MKGFGINVLGPIRVMHAFLPLLRVSENPRIVNVSSGVGSFARLLTPGTVENAVTLPVYPATQSLTEGTDAIVRLATLPKDGPTGTFQDRNGTVPW